MVCIEPSYWTWMGLKRFKCRWEICFVLATKRIYCFWNHGHRAGEWGVDELSKCQDAPISGAQNCNDIRAV